MSIYILNNQIITHLQIQLLKYNTLLPHEKVGRGFSLVKTGIFLKLSGEKLPNVERIFIYLGSLRHCNGKINTFGSFALVIKRMKWNTSNC